eukprot:tig00000215_g18648.t1
MAKRAAKRARTAEPSTPANFSSIAVASSAAAAEACASGEGVNHFARLPDELVRRILSELEATEAYETCQLWSLDRRFRQLMRGVHWQLLRIEPSDDGDQLASLKAYRQRLERVTARIRSRALAGCRRLVVGPPFAGGHPAVHVGSKESVEACIVSARAMSEMLGALSVAPAPLEDVCFSGDWMVWPRLARQKELGIDNPQPLEHVVSAFLTALRPAPLRALRLEDLSVFWHFIRVAAMGCLPHLQELSFEQTYSTNVTKEITSKLVKLWSGLKKIACNVNDGDVLRVLSQLPLEELRVTAESCAGVEEALEAFKTDCVRALHLPAPLGSLQPQHTVSPRLLALIVRLRNLEELTASIDHSSGDALAGLGALQKLRSLTFHLDLFSASAGGAGVLQAAAAALAALPRLESLVLVVKGLTLDPAGLASLIRAGRPCLRELRITNTLASAEVLQEVARAGPKLGKVYILYCGPPDAGIGQLGPCSELLSVPEDRPPGFHR